MVNDFCTLNCNFLQLLIKWLRQPPLPDKHYFNFNIPGEEIFWMQGISFPLQHSKLSFNNCRGCEGWGWKKYETSFLFILLHPPSSRGANNSWSLNNEWRYICQDSLVIPESCMWHKSSSLLYRSPNHQIKLNFELFYALVWNLVHFPQK